MILRNSERLWVTLMNGFERLGRLRLTEWGPPRFANCLLWPSTSQPAAEITAVPASHSPIVSTWWRTENSLTLSEEPIDLPCVRQRLLLSGLMTRHLGCGWIGTHFRIP